MNYLELVFIIKLKSHFLFDHSLYAKFQFFALFLSWFQLYQNHQLNKY